MQLTDYVTNKASNNLMPEFSLYCNFMSEGSFYQKGLTKGFPYAMCSCYCILCYNNKGGSKFPVDFATKAPYESLYSSDSESSSDLHLTVIVVHHHFVHCHLMSKFHLIRTRT